jgi:Flp pilus assembly pilin Flp
VLEGRGDERGVTLVEYGVGVTLAVVVGITLLTALGSGINGNLIDAADSMDASGCTTNATTGVVTCS